MPKAKQQSLSVDGGITSFQVCLVGYYCPIPKTQVPICFLIGQVLGKVSVIHGFKQSTVFTLHVRHSFKSLNQRGCYSTPSWILYLRAYPGRTGLVLSTISFTRSAFHWRSLRAEHQESGCVQLPFSRVLPLAHALRESRSLDARAGVGGGLGTVGAAV